MPFPKDLPIIPKLPPEAPQSPYDLPGNKAVARCGECGRVIYQMEMYSCQHPRCPVQPKVVL